ncbi:MAG: CBS domain-containing protein [Alphaproteobacteria bacterium]|nr:CBS domain-containing protein [Alphaproteobacteria bacterium]
MQPTKAETLETLRAATGFLELTEIERDGLAETVMGEAHTAGATVVELGRQLDCLYIVHGGSLEIRSATGKIFARIKRGEVFGVRVMRSNRHSNYRVVATQDAVVLKLARQDYEALVEVHPNFDSFFERVGFERGQGSGAETLPSRDAAIDLMTTAARDLMTAGIITAPPATTVLEAARMMSAHNVSCLPIVEGGKVVGMLTDTDLRNRILAKAAPTSGPVSEIMSTTISTLECDALAFDALVLMMKNDISHLPLTESGRLIGILTHTNLVRAQSRSAVYMIGEIHRLEKVAEMAKVVRQIPELLVSLVESGASAHKIGRIITSIADALTHRLIALAEDKLGEAPVPYVWAACGSQGRQEQTGISDQDNCLIIDDSYDEASNGAYFTEFAKFVSDGLDECGYFYCPGDMMATNPEWRQPLSVWNKYFADWVERPGPKAQMLASVMFDLRPIHGKIELFEKLQEQNLDRARKNSIFIAHLLSNALTHTPPLGFFGTLSLEGGEHRGTINLKQNGVVPVVDVARVYALEASISEVNTHKRLELGRSANVMSESGAADLLAAFEFIAITRLRHQSRQIRAGEKPDNFMMPDEISHLERDQLKKAFQVVKTIQSALSNAHQIGAR